MRLAAMRRGVVVAVGDEPVRAQELIVLTDGADLALLFPLMAQVRAAETRVLAIGVPSSLVGGALGGRITHVEDGPGPSLWRRVLAALETPGEPAVACHRRWFFSHASADEARIEPAVAYLRRELGLDVFLCSDSIAAGSVWQSEIATALEQADAMLFVCSAASAASVFCAWELGWATGRGVRLRILRIDDVAPPVSIQHLQMADVGRLLRSRPWLDTDDALLHGLLQAMAD
jgi:hypothetical protein